MNKFDNVPASACQLRFGECELKQGDGGKNEITVLARSGGSIEHWYWGKVAHDLSGLKAKDHVTLDYCHDDGEVLGYLDKRAVTDKGLEMSGVLIPFKEGDRASEVLHKSKAGVNYESSINFGGDGIKFERVEKGKVAQVNGKEFAGPGVIIREWPLRGVAVCPYGYDGNTESKALTNSSKTYKAFEFSNPKNEVKDMGKELDNKPAVGATPPVPDKPAEQLSAPPAEPKQQTPAPDKPAEVSPVDKFQRLADAHGYEFAKTNFGKSDMEIAQAMIQAQDTKISELSAKIGTGADPVKFQPAAKSKLRLSSLFVKGDK